MLKFYETISSIAATAITLGVLSACSSSTPATKPTPIVTGATRDYMAERAKYENTDIVSAGFTLRIHHSADESISGAYKVNFKGVLKLPYKVDILAAGLTTDALAEKISNAYKSFFKIKNAVNVEIITRDFLIEIRGLVQKPGIYTATMDTTVEEVIALGGGIAGVGTEGRASGPKPEYVRIVTPSYMFPKGAPPAVRWVRLSDYFLNYDVGNEVVWRGGEKVFFQRTGDPDTSKGIKSQTVQIMGEVREPGEYPVQPGLDLHSYLAQAGGPTASADLADITIVQRSAGNSSSFDITKSGVIVQVAPGDLILVKSTQLKPGFWERVGPTLIALGGLAISVVTLVIAL